MGEMGQAIVTGKNDGHVAIATAVRDLGELGYRVKHIQYQPDGLLVIGCYCPQDNEGSNEVKT